MDALEAALARPEHSLAVGFATGHLLQRRQPDARLQAVAGRIVQEALDSALGRRVFQELPEHVVAVLVDALLAVASAHELACAVVVVAGVEDRCHILEQALGRQLVARVVVEPTFQSWAQLLVGGAAERVAGHHDGRPVVDGEALQPVARIEGTSRAMARAGLAQDAVPGLVVPVGHPETALPLFQQKTCGIEAALDVHGVVAHLHQLPAQVVGKVFLHLSIRPQRVGEGLSRDAAHRIVGECDALAQRVDGGRQASRRVVLIVARLAPVVHLLDDAAQRIAPQRVALPALVGQSDQPLLGVVVVLHRLAIGLDAPADAAGAHILQPCLGAAFVDMDDQLILCVVAAVDLPAARVLDTQQPSLGIVVIAVHAAQHVGLLGQPAQYVVVEAAFMAQRIGQRAQLAVPVMPQLGERTPCIDMLYQLPASIVRETRDGAPRVALAGQKTASVIGLGPAMAEWIDDGEHPVLVVELVADGAPVRPPHPQQVAPCVIREPGAQPPGAVTATVRPTSSYSKVVTPSNGSISANGSPASSNLTTVRCPSELVTSVCRSAAL